MESSNNSIKSIGNNTENIIDDIDFEGLKKYLKRDFTLFILKELEFARRYVEFRWRNIVFKGLYAPFSSKIYFTKENNRDVIVLEIKIQVPEIYGEPDVVAEAYSNIKKTMRRQNQNERKRLEQENYIDIFEDENNE